VTEIASASETGWRITTARSVEELDALAEIWDRMPGHEVTADREHFLTVLRLRPEAVRPHVVLLEREGEPVALAAGRIEDIRLPAKIGYRTIVSPRLRALTIVVGGFLGDTSEPVARRMLDELRSALARGEADVLRLRVLELETPLHRLARTVPRALVRDHSGKPSVHWTVTIPDSFDEFLRARSKTMRSNIRYYAKRIETEYEGRLALETFHDGSYLERLYRDTAVVAEKTYQHALGASFVDDPLRRALTELSVRRGWFRAYLLSIDGKPVAFWYGTAYRGSIHTGFTGYDPEYRDLSIGTYVLAKLIEEACADPEIVLLDHGFGDADYKRRLGDRSWLEEDVLVYAPTFKGVRSNLARTAVGGVASLARRALRDRGAVARVKRRWRDRLRSSPGR
jgi:CelD/BcsL family acetyltransferase involved in cellulose biosynthesis